MTFALRQVWKRLSAYMHHAGALVRFDWHIMKAALVDIAIIVVVSVHHCINVLLNLC